ncbi:unnamed protein product, partial [Iphiclides podalirius]
MLVCIILKRPVDSLDDPSDQFLVKNIPATYTKLEGIDPEERDVFEGFRTSFLPAEEILLAQRKWKRALYDEKKIGDSFIWENTDEKLETPTRTKRKSHLPYSSTDFFAEDTGGNVDDEYYDLSIENYTSEASHETAETIKNDFNKKTIYQEIYVDRGPLDDVVEQVRRQPELEEGEMGSSAHLYKPSNFHTGIHAFWKGEGDRITIRKTQANIMKQYMDAEADPCHDFYQYACGNWAALNPIPPDKAGYDTFEMLRENLDAVLKDLLEFKSFEKVESVYPGQHLDIKKRGHQPLLDLLDLLGGWPILNPDWNDSKFNWLELMAKLRVYNNDILISEWVGPDIKNSDEFVIQFDQTSLGLPTRDYFLQESNKVYLDAYKTYLTTIALLLGGKIDHVKKCADKLIDFEINLAKITSAPEDRRNVSEIYQRMPIWKLIDLIPEVDWIQYLCIVMNKTINENETIVLFAHNYVSHLVKLINKTEADTLANYLLWRFVRHRVNNLDDRFQSAKQQFYYVLFGREEAPPRWKNCISQVNSNMGMALGSMFVRKYFDEMSKNDTLKMTREIQQSFREILRTTHWIDDATKKLARHKVDSMMLRIGYPDFILNKKELDDRYKEVKIHPDKYFENILNILQHLTKMEQSRIGQPVNKSLWNTAPAVVNAYYSRNKNQIMFPAGILQPPFYHRHFPRSLNYGGIGVVIGHEITHGFDDKGRLFDCEGNLHRWWSDPAIEAFHNRAQCLIDQYGRYVVPEVNMKLDGVNTQGENIADNGGVKQAFHAYLKWLEHHDAKDETLPGLNHTHTQLFFLNFAQVWCGAMRPEAMRNKLKTAVHSPGRFRVIGTLSNSKDFAKEFGCPPGSPMNPKQKCSVW